MVRAASSPGRDRIAIVASIALHCCVLAAFVATPRPSLSLDDPDERALLARTIHVERRYVPPMHRKPTLHRAGARTVRPAVLPVVHAAVAVEHSARALIVAPERRAEPVLAERAPARRPVDPAPHDASVAAVAEPAAEALPTGRPSPVASAAPAAPVALHDEGVGNFGESYPASIEPGARGTLLAGMAGFDVRIEVDETGRATTVEFVRGPADPALRDEFRARLLAARFIPAACNGLRCAGSFELKS